MQGTLGRGCISDLIDFELSCRRCRFHGCAAYLHATPFDIAKASSTFVILDASDETSEDMTENMADVSIGASPFAAIDKVAGPQLLAPFNQGSMVGCCTSSSEPGGFLWEIRPKQVVVGQGTGVGSVGCGLARRSKLSVGLSLAVTFVHLCHCYSSPSWLLSQLRLFVAVTVVWRSCWSGWDW